MKDKNTFIRKFSPGGGYEDLDADLLTLEDLREQLHGWPTVISISGLSVVCDEEGRIKGLPATIQTSAGLLVGNVYVGRLTSKGLTGASQRKLTLFTDMSIPACQFQSSSFCKSTNP